MLAGYGHGLATTPHRLVSMRMDSFTEGESEEFFETLEVIPVSSPSSESESGGDDICRKPAAMAKVSVESQRVLLSKYEVWQNDTSSILERRQRLFSQMGIRLEREDSKRALVFLESLSPPVISKHQNMVESGSRSHNLDDNLKDQQRTMGIGHGLSQESADNSHVADKSHDICSRLARSGSTSPPAQSCGANVAQIHETFALLRSGSSGHVLSASSFGNKSSLGRSIDILRSNSVQEGAFLNQLNVGNRGPLQDFANLSEEEYTSQVIREDGTIPFNGNIASQVMQDTELICRIKDLDTGKEFVVNTGSKDGVWNKVKELETGRVLSLEEFESSVGFSPIVQEVMKRERASDDSGAIDAQVDIPPGEKKKKAWFRSIKGLVNGSRDKGHYKSGSSGRIASLEKSGRRSSSESNDSRESPTQLAKRVKVHVHKKSTKDFADLYLRQEIQAHEGAIWTMKFSFDGSFLASAGQDKVVRVWEVVEHDRGGQTRSQNTGDPFSMVQTTGDPLQSHNHLKVVIKESSTAVSSPRWTSKPFFFLEKPKHAFVGHKEDVLDLSWSQSQFLLSSSMDKTVRLWNVTSGECLRVFAHNDYVTCIHFNPVDDGYFISGSLDGKVRIWSIKDRQVVDWVDLCEMVTAACYTQNGQGAAVGSYKGTCYLYKTSDSKLQFNTKFEVQRRRKKRSQGKKITGFQFVPGDEGKILITSSDSRIRVYDGSKVCSKYIGLRNNNSQISASFSFNGMYVICASEDSRVCIWKYYDSSLHSVQKQKSLSRSYEDFFAQHVSIAIPWPGSGLKLVPEKQKTGSSGRNIDVSPISIPADKFEHEMTCNSSPEDGRKEKLVHDDPKEHVCNGSTRTSSQHSEQKSCFSGRETSSAIVTSPMLEPYLEDCCSVLSKAGQDQQNGSGAFSSDGRGSGACWPEDSLPSVSLDRNSSHENKVGFGTAEDVVDKKVSAIATAWGLIIVTAGLGGEIQVFQNQSVPV